MTENDRPTQATPSTEAPPEAGRAGLKLLLELGPLILFFVLYKRHEDPREGLIQATKWFLMALLISLPLVWRLERKVPWMAIVTAIFVGVFGGLTIALDNDLFIKLKPTVASLFIAGALMAGLLRGKLFLRTLLGATLRMDDEGWKILTLRYSGFFFLVAIGNEIVWRNFSNDVWVNYKVWGILPLTMVFMMSQVGLMRRHELQTDKVEKEPGS
jgi:intracellular septation protein